MAFLVTNGSLCQCTFGLAPCPLMVLPLKRILAGGMPLATIMDHKPIINLVSFGMCSSLANPAVVAATSAALEVLTPMPCIPNTPAPWVPGSPITLAGGEPVLNNSSKLTCLWGGLISITATAQFTCQG